MKLLLVQPPIQDFYDTEIRLQPIGLSYLKAAILKHLPDVNTTVKDYHQGWGRCTIAIPEELKFLEAYYGTADKSPFAVFNQYYHYGASFKVLADDVAAESPDFVGISSLFSPYFREVITTAKAIKSKINVPIVIGGPHASAMPDDVIKSSLIDFVIRGEGERPIVDLLNAWKTGRKFREVPNLVYREGTAHYFTELKDNYPLDDIPMPDFSDFPFNRYTFEGRPLAVVLTSRGCPYHCDFCSAHTAFPGPYRRRKNESILDEIRYRYDCGVRIFDFEDDNLTHDRDAAKDLFAKLADIYRGRDIQFLAMNGISYWDLDDEMLGLMTQSGFTHLNLSLVSVNEKVLRKHHRPFDLEKHRQIVRKAFELGLKTVSYQILGLPVETLDSTIDGLIHAARLPVLIGASPLYLPPGSPLYDSRQHGAIPFVSSRLTALGSSVASLPPDSIYTLLMTARIIDFLKGLTFHDSTISWRKALDIAKKGDKRSQIGAELLDRLLLTGELYGSTSKGWVKLDAFRTDVFQELWRRIGMIVTQGGKVIRVE